MRCFRLYNSKVEEEHTSFSNLEFYTLLSLSTPSP